VKEEKLKDIMGKRWPLGEALKGSCSAGGLGMLSAPQSISFGSCTAYPNTHLCQFECICSLGQV